ncbi:hypothetical protein V6W75_07890 [Mannheimia sp. HC-2023]
MRKNQFNQLIGEEVSHFSAGEVPSLQYVEGKYCYLALAILMIYGVFTV